MSLERFCRRPPVTVTPTQMVITAASEMLEKHVGSVVVVDAKGHPTGILTDRDLACRVVAPGLDPKSTRVEQVMSPADGCIASTALIEEASFKMRQLGVRRLPIVDADGRATGIVTLDDLMVLLTAELGHTAMAIRSNRGP